MSPSAAVAAVLAAATPSPTPAVELESTGAGSPGFVGFLVTFGLAVAVVLLVRSLSRHLRVVDRRAAALEESEGAPGPDDPGPVGEGPVPPGPDADGARAPGATT